MSGLKDLIDKHMSTLRGNGQEVLAALMSDPVDLEAARGVAHMIKGASGSIGFAEYSGAAMELEKHLKSIIASQTPPNEETNELTNKFAEILSRLEPTDSTLYPDS